MYKVNKTVLEDTTKILDVLVDYLYEDEKTHFQVSPTKNHIYKAVLAAKKQSKLIKDNYTDIQS